MAEKLSLSGFLPYRCNRFAERISHSLAKIYSDDFGISEAEWRVVAMLSEQDNLLAKHIGEATHMDKVRVSRAVQALSEKGFIKKRQSKEDSRATHLSLSKKGETLYKKITPKLLAWEKQLLSGVNKRDTKQLLTMLDQMEARLDTF